MILQSTIFRTNIFGFESFDSWLCVLESRSKKKLSNIAAGNKEQHIHIYMLNRLDIITAILQNIIFRTNLFPIEIFDSRLCPVERLNIAAGNNVKAEHIRSYLLN